MMLKEKTQILGVGVSIDPLGVILEYLTDFIEKSDGKLFIVTPNPEIIYHASQDPVFRKVLNDAQIALPDGVGVLMAASLLGKPVKRRITGVDFIENVCERVSKRPITVGFIGGKQNVAETSAKCLIEKYPGLKVAFAGAEWDQIEAKSEKLKCDILFVGLGFPKQEFWISENLPKIDVKVAVGVGGGLDYISGKVPRAPKLLRKLGLEWLFRLLVQPWRMKRQARLIHFVLLILKEKFNRK